MESELKIDVESVSGVVILKMHGDVTSFAEEELLARFDSQTAAGERKFVLDFSGVDYINSSGIAIIIQLLSRAKKNEARVLCCGLTAHFQKVFEMVGLKKYTELYSNSEEAVQHLQ